MRDSPDPACVSYDSRLSNPTTLASQQPIKFRFNVKTLATLYTILRRTSLCETRLSKVARHKAMIGGDHENTAYANKNRSSGTTACFFGLVISDADLCMVPNEGRERKQYIVCYVLINNFPCRLHGINSFIHLDFVLRHLPSAFPPVFTELSATASK